jgi:hypothetical protein
MYLNQRELTSPRSPERNKKSSRPLAAYPPADRNRNGEINRKTGAGYQAQHFYRDGKHTGLSDILLKISLCSEIARSGAAPPRTISAEIADGRSRGFDRKHPTCAATQQQLFRPRLTKPSSHDL